MPFPTKAKMTLINDVTCDGYGHIPRDTRALLASSCRSTAHPTPPCDRRLVVVVGYALSILLGLAIGHVAFGSTAVLAPAPPDKGPFTYPGPARRAPHIAVVAQPSYDVMGQDWIPGSVVSWLESAGAVVVPVPSGVYWNESGPNWTTSQASTWTPERYTEIFNSVNGLMLPGGDPWPQVSSGAVRQLHALALAANARGDYFPIWGTCAGMETLVALAAGGCQARVTDGAIPTGACAARGPITRGWDSINLSSTLQLSLPVTKNARLLGPGAGTVLQGWLAQEPITFNAHSGAAAVEVFAPPGKLGEVFDVLSTSVDRRGRRYASTIEGRTAPIYGVQWHPEKALFEWGLSEDGSPYEAINHSSHAIAAARYTADFFVGEARQSTHMFATSEAALAASIYQLVPTAYDPTQPMYTRKYLIDWNTTLDTI